jgi:hypothetical protein
LTPRANGIEATRVSQKQKRRFAIRAASEMLKIHSIINHSSFNKLLADSRFEFRCLVLDSYATRHHRHPLKMMKITLGVKLISIIAATGLMLVTALCAFGQGSGRIKGTVRVASGAPVAGVVVVATNQVTGKWKRVRSNADGVYSIQLSAGAYRLKVSPPHVAKFEKSEGEFTLPKGEALENVIVEADKETVVDIPLEQIEIKEVQTKPGDKPTGHAGATTVPSAPQTNEDRREARDRWRIGFPEYDRYGDRAARGRDIPFKRGRWWDPYNQSVLKGDYPIKGNKTFMILSAVSTTTVEQRRAPTPSDVSSDEPRSAEFFGQPEQFAASETSSQF